MDNIRIVDASGKFTLGTVRVKTASGNSQQSKISQCLENKRSYPTMAQESSAACTSTITLYCIDCEPPGTFSTVTG